jgi:hypothetical protein
MCESCSFSEKTGSRPPYFMYPTATSRRDYLAPGS